MYLVLRLSSTQTIEAARRFHLVSSNDANQVLVSSHKDPYAEADPDDTAPRFELSWNTNKGILIWRGDRSFFYHAIDTLRQFSQDFSRFQILSYKTEEPHLHFWETQASYLTNRAPQGLVIKVLKDKHSEEVLAIDLRRLTERFRLTKAVDYLKSGNMAALSVSFDNSAAALARLIINYEERQHQASVDPHVHRSRLDYPQAIAAHGNRGHGSVVSLVRSEGGKKTFTNLDPIRKLEKPVADAPNEPAAKLNETTFIPAKPAEELSNAEQPGAPLVS